MLGRARRLDDEAVSTVVSAVLVFSLVTVVFSVYMSTMVPDQVADAEAIHMRQVASSLGDVAAEIDRDVHADRSAQFVTQMDLGTTTVPGLGMFHSSGSLEIQESALFANFICYAPRLLARDQHAAPGNAFNAFGPAFDTNELLVLDVRVNAYTFGASDHVATITATSQGDTVGTFRITLAQATGAIKVRTTDAAGTVVFDQILQAGFSTIDAYIVNALDPLYGFASILGDSPAPLHITTSSDTASLQLYALYWKPDGGLGQLGQGRLLPTGFQRTVDSAALVYRSGNKEFLQQTYSFEAGALALEQENGQFLNLAPFTVTTPGTQNLLRLSLLNITGAGHVSGSHRATITTNVQDPTTSVMECSDPTLLVSTEFPRAWHTAWTDALDRAELDPTQATISGSTTNARLTGTWTVILTEARTDLRLG